MIQPVVAAKPRAFFFHFNKPASRKVKEARWSVHQSGVCHIVRDVTFRGVKVKTHYRSKQPICVLKGRGVVRVVDGNAFITSK